MSHSRHPARHIEYEQHFLGDKITTTRGQNARALSVKAQRILEMGKLPSSLLAGYRFS